MISLFLAAAATQSHGVVRTFADWTVGCDNGRSCQAVGLMPEASEDGATMVIVRGPEPDAIPQIRINIPRGPTASLALDGKPLPIRIAMIEGDVHIDRRDALDAVKAIRNGQRIDILDGARKMIGSVSLRGLTAALIFMDDQQKRVGFLSAIGRPGTIPDSDVEPPPALPNITLPPRSAAPPRRLSPTEIALQTKALKCDVPISQAAKSDHIRLDARTTLVLFDCESYAYNFVSYALVIDEAGKARDAVFDESPGQGEGNGNRLVNPNWDAATRRLSLLDKARGLGDCGVEQAYVWDGTRFRLVYEALMNECRGSTDFIPVWRATVSER